jgi:hypothetical protein
MLVKVVTITLCLSDNSQNCFPPSLYHVLSPACILNFANWSYEFCCLSKSARFINSFPWKIPISYIREHKLEKGYQRSRYWKTNWWHNFNVMFLKCLYINVVKVDEVLAKSKICTWQINSLNWNLRKCWQVFPLMETLPRHIFFMKFEPWLTERLANFEALTSTHFLLLSLEFVNGYLKFQRS